MRFLLLLAMLFVLQFTTAQTGSSSDTIQTRIIFVGDAGALVNGKSIVLDAVKKNCKFDKNTSIVFLGDNLYDYGLPSEYHDEYLKQKEALDSQIMIANGTDARVYMLPGNHDWSNGTAVGELTVVRQQRYVDFAGLSNVKFYPEDGCPGPVEVQLGPNVVLIVFDSQWWIHPYEKPGIESDCPYKMPEQVLSQVEEILNKNYKKLVIFACHHPFKSNGVHGGYFTLKQHIFPFTEINRNAYIPLPILGSAYPIARSVFGTPQDLKYPAYQNMVDQFNKVLRNHPHVIRAHGHEHTLQYIKNDSLNEIISGAGCKTQRVSPGGDAKYVARSLGFAELEISTNKTVRLKMFEVSPNEKDSVKIGYNEIIEDFTKQPELPQEDTTIAVPVYNKLVLAPASVQYQEAHGLKKLVNGQNYRKEWSTLVPYKVFDINTEKGGFTIKGIGGGKQTKSLQLMDKQGREWALRTIDKDPEEAIPENLRGSFAQSIVQDLISAAHPYAPLTVPTLANAVGVIVAEPELFYVPDDRAFGYYRPLFAKKICLLELKDLDKENNSKSSYKVFNNMRDDNRKTIDQEMVLRARLLDMLLGDYDRHFDQWKWIEGDTGKGKIYIPVPRDRDQVFFNSDGMLVNLVADRMFPFMNGFKKDFHNINGFNMVGKDFDRLFLNNIDEHKWREAAKDFAENLPDSLIEKAVLKMPKEIYAIRGEEITKKLISRKNQIEKESLKYYRFLSKKVQVLGSNKNELFHLYRVKDSMKLDVFSYTAKDTSFLLYSREFDPRVTKELLLFGFGGDDVFKIDENLRRVKLRIVGGRGEDSFIVKSNVKTFIYDSKKEKTGVIGMRKTKDRINNAVRVNDFELRGFKYDQLLFPKGALGYNVDDGLFIGTGFSMRKYGFRKYPYASDQRLAILGAITKRAYQMKYAGEFVDFWNSTTLAINAKLTQPVLTNFFGFGNSTSIDKTKGTAFYRVRYSEAKLDLLLRRRPFEKLTLSAGPSIYYYWNNLKNNKKYVLSQPSFLGLDSEQVYRKKLYVGATAEAEFSNINSDLFPTRGVSITTKYDAMFPVSGDGVPINKLEGNMTIYASLKDPARVVTVLKMGGGHIFRKRFDYFQAISIGADNNLRGFRKTRFSGQTAAYGSLEFRIKVLKGKSYVVPGQVGLIAFADAGKVWYEGADSRKIHMAYGGGFYFVPFNIVIISAAVAFSEEERLLNFSIGTKLNLTF